VNRELACTYRACAQITRQEARNFYYAFIRLPRAQRLSVYALYAFCREADDIADSVQPVEVKRSALGQLRVRLRSASAGTSDSERDLALADTFARFGVSVDDLDDVLNGMELDLTLHRVQSEAELTRYCYLAASAVGLATLPVLNDGIPPTDSMRDLGVDLGLGMQLVNILRDVREDLERDRIYLPADRLEAFGVPVEDLKAGRPTPPIRALLADHANRAEGLLKRGRELAPLLPRGGRQCIRLLASLYGTILEKIRAADYDVFSSRVNLSTAEKLKLLICELW